MNRSHLLLVSLTSLSLIVACGDAGGDGETLGGSAGGSAGSSGSAAGTTGKGGSGISGSGGSAGVAGGQAGTGGTGTSGKGGAAGKAGASGKGGAAGGAGASGTGGSATGGAAGKAGAAGATGGKGGSGGAGGSTGGTAGSAGASAGSAGAAGATGGSAGSAGSAGATGGSAGAGGSTGGSAGTGGAGGGCASPMDCPQPPAMCVQATCTMGVCGTGPSPMGTPTVIQTPGDCHQSVCDGNGGQMANVDDGDVPVDGTTCTDDVCTLGVASNPPVALGTMCSDNNGQFCDAGGKCVECNSPADCGGGMCVMNACVPVLLISEVQTRGSAGANDEFVEIYNPMSIAVTFDSMWKLESRSSAAATYGGRFTGSGQSIPAHGHLLIVGSAYDNATAADGNLTSSITDAGSLRLLHGAATVDAVCFYFDNTTFAALDATYTCEGTPVINLPHNNNSSAASNADASIERKPGGALGNGVDTNVNAADFTGNTPSNPQDLASTPVPLPVRHSLRSSGTDHSRAAARTRASSAREPSDSAPAARSPSSDAK